MIKSFLIYCSVLITSLSLIYCGNKADGEGSKVSSEKALLAHKNEIEKQKEDSINKLLNEIKVRIFNHDELFIDMECVLSELTACRLKCYYCEKKCYIIYNEVLSKTQWTVDRIDNNCGHNKGNIVIACLECNIRRGTMDSNRFKLGKQLKFIKKDHDDILL